MVNSYTYLRVYEQMMVASIDVSEEETGIKTSRTELDSHANMPVVGGKAYVISDIGRIADVNSIHAGQ